MKHISKGFVIVAVAGAIAALALGALAFFELKKPVASPVAGATCTGSYFGGTGVCYPTVPVYGNVLVGNAAGGYTLTATSSLGITGGGGGSQNIASVLTQGNDANGLALSDLGTTTTSIILATSTTATSYISNLAGKVDPTYFSTAGDMGTKVNATYAASLSSGVNINIPMATTTAGTSYAVGIAANTNNKFLRITCALGGGASNNGNSAGNELIYTGTTGTSTAFNTNNYIAGGASGIDGCNLTGTNGTTARITDGVFLGGTNGSFSGYVKNSNVSGFGTGVVYRPSTSFNEIVDSTIHFNGRNVSEPDTSGANCENQRILESVIADANNQAGGVTDLKGLYVQESGNCQWNIGFTSIDDNQNDFDQFGGTLNVNTFIADHQENPNGHIYPMIIGNSGGTNNVFNLIGGDMMNDVVAGQPDQMEVAGQVNLIGFSSDSNNNVTSPVTRIVNALASSTIITWAGLSCKGANANSFVYGNIPCSPFGVGSDYGAPSLYTASSTSAGIGSVGVGTSTVGVGTSNNLAFFQQAMLNVGQDPGNTGTTTMRMSGKIQIEGKNSAGTVVCFMVNGTTPTVITGACPSY